MPTGKNHSCYLSRAGRQDLTFPCGAWSTKLHHDRTMSECAGRVTKKYWKVQYGFAGGGIKTCIELHHALGVPSPLQTHLVASQDYSYGSMPNSGGAYHVYKKAVTQSMVLSPRTLLLSILGSRFYDQLSMSRNRLSKTSCNYVYGRRFKEY